MSYRAVNHVGGISKISVRESCFFGLPILNSDSRAVAGRELFSSRYNRFPYQCHFFAGGLYQTHVKPYPVLVFSEHTFQRRPDKIFQPFSMNGRQGRDLILNSGMNIAKEPRSGVIERKGLQRSKRIAVSFGPLFPKFIVACMSVQKRGQFMNMMDNPITYEQVTKNVKGEVAEVINPIQSWKRHAFQRAANPTIPKAICFWHKKPRDVFVPKTEMEFDRKGHVRIKGIPAPLPIT